MFKDLAFFKDYNLFNNNQSVSFLRYLTVKTNFTMPMCSHGRDDKKEFVLLMQPHEAEAITSVGVLCRFCFCFLDDIIEKTPVQRDEEIADRQCSITVKDERFDCQESVNTSKQR